MAPPRRREETRDDLARLLDEIATLLGEVEEELDDTDVDEGRPE